MISQASKDVLIALAATWEASTNEQAKAIMDAIAELERTAAFDELLAACEMEIGFRDWMSGRLSEEKLETMLKAHGWSEPTIECDFTHDFMVSAIAKARGANGGRR